MIHPISRFAKSTGWHNSKRLERQVRDYVLGGKELVAQRHAIFLVATALTAFYFDANLALACYSFVLLTELFDNALSRRILACDSWDLGVARRYLTLLLLSTFLSSLAVCTFVILISSQAGPSAYFSPLFFLFAAALFAAINNHQLPAVLLLRLVMYGASFLYIPLHDIVRLAPPIEDILWLQLFTSAFVMYFVIDCSLIFLKLYRRNLRQMDVLKVETKRAKVAYKAKSEFLSTVSHELRTPLTSISASLDLLASGALDAKPEKKEPILSIAKVNCKRLTNLVEDILLLQLLESDDFTLDLQPVEIGEVLRHAVDARNGFAKERGVSLILKDGANDAVVFSDLQRALRVFDNLLSNAVKFSQEGGTVEVAVETAKDTASISIKADGVGIPEEAKDRVFEKFSQVDNSDMRAIGGTGLGLCISRLILKKNKGSISYTSELGKGTTFVVTLPLSA
jgi:signal transduction histidine kinase